MIWVLKGGRERLGKGSRACGVVCNLVLALGLSSCRVYRDDGGMGGAPGELRARGGDGPAEAPGEAASKPSTLTAPKDQPPPAEALSLWVLNRPETELVARGPEEPPTPAGEVVSTPRALALVVLGLGPEHGCAELFARRALRYTSDGMEPLQALMTLLEDVRRWRWPDSAILNASVRASDGRFGAVQAIPGGAFSSRLLAAAVQRRAVLDGRNRRWHEPAPGAPLQGPLGAQGAELRCESLPGPELHGPAGVLLHTEDNSYFGGLLDPVSPADAGVISGATQYGVSVAAGPSGGVLLLSDCTAIPHEALAANVYAALTHGAPAPGRGTGEGCQLNHAMVSGWAPSVTGTGPLAWASAVDRDWVSAEDPPRADPPPRTADAGAQPAPTPRQP